jgi:phosphoribosylformylglycinamidine cyclo-ligase
MTKPFTYRDAGVDIDAGNEAVERIKRMLKGHPMKVPGGEAVGGIGGFGGCFRPILKGYKDPLLVGSTDGVGTKLLVALEYNRLETIGQDLVAMCVNDLVVGGARPLFFLDYIATAKLEPDQVETIVGSIQKACEESQCLLIGGETAEMPGMYAPGHTDLAGFAVGIVDSDKAIDGSSVAPGDIVLGLASSGLHSNGYSLVRKVIENTGWKPDEFLLECTEPLLDIVIKPTRLYVKPLLALYDALGTGNNGGVKSVAHITGGGLAEKIIRVIPETCAIMLERSRWPEPGIFRRIRDAAALSDAEMDRTFNRGIGCVVVVKRGDVSKAGKILEAAGEKVYEIGRIEARKGKGSRITIK